MKAFLYILKNKQGKYYVGSTDNLERRLKQHRSNQSPTTKRLKAYDLVFYQEYSSLLDARKIEKKIKLWKRKDYIDRIIKDKCIRIMPW